MPSCETQPFSHPKETKPNYCLREPGKIHGAGVVPLVQRNGELAVLVIREQQTDLSLGKIPGALSFPMGHIDEERDGPIEEGGAIKAALRELWEETGIRIDPDPNRFPYYGRFDVPGLNDPPLFGGPFNWIDQSIPEFGQEIYLLKPVHKSPLNPTQELSSHGKTKARLDVFGVYFSNPRLPSIPSVYRDHLADTTEPHWVPLSELTSEYLSTHLSRPERVSPQEAMLLHKYGQAMGGEELVITPFYARNGFPRAGVTDVADYLKARETQIKAHFGIE